MESEFKQIIGLGIVSMIIYLAVIAGGIVGVLLMIKYLFF